MRRTVLAVDDSRTMRDMLRLALTQAGIDARFAGDGIEGLDMLAALTPDVIITDINMPRMDGFRFIDAVRGDERHRGVPILVLTTENGEDLKRRARDAGATGWIVKPFDPAKLVRAIDMVAA